MKSLRKNEILLWVVGGGLNTILTYALYLLLKLFIPFRLAYSITYIIGIVFAYFFNSLIVFKRPLTVRKFFQFPLVYLVQYLLSMGLLEIFVKWFNLDTNVSPILVLIIVTPITYLLSKFILQDRSAPSGKKSL